MRRTLIATIIMIVAVATITGWRLMNAAASTATARTEHFRIMSTSAISRKQSVIATGEFTAGGIAIPGRFADKLVFAGGTFKITYRFITFKAYLNPRTCLLTESQQGTYRLGHGTGAYAGIRGSGKVTADIMGIFARNSKRMCTHLSAPATFQSILIARGPVRR